jgi:hypothetical protein
MQHDLHLTNSNYYTSRIHRWPDHRAIHNQTYTPLPLQTQTTFGKSPTTRLATTRCRCHDPRGTANDPQTHRKGEIPRRLARQTPQIHNAPEEDACKGSRESRGTARHLRIYAGIIIDGHADGISACHHPTSPVGCISMVLPTGETYRVQLGIM